MLFVEVPYLIPAAGGGRTLPPGGGGRQRPRWESGESGDAVTALAKGVDCGNGGHLLWCSCAQCSTEEAGSNTSKHKDCLWVALLPIIDSNATSRDSSLGDR